MQTPKHMANWTDIFTRWPVRRQRHPDAHETVQDTKERHGTRQTTRMYSTVQYSTANGISYFNLEPAQGYLSRRQSDGLGDEPRLHLGP